MKKTYIVNQENQIILLSDLHFWMYHIHELDLWCEVNGCSRSGTAILYNTQEDLTMFAIKWL